MEEQDILKLPKNRNYHYEFKTMDNEEIVILYYKLSDSKWQRHIDCCKVNGFENNIKQWLNILVNKEDFELVKDWGLSVTLDHLRIDRKYKKHYFSIRLDKRINKKLTNHSIHRYILKPPSNMQVDHINGNTFDNRRCNLRVVARFENKQNMDGSMSNSKTGIRGVSIKNNRRNKYYYAQVYKNNKQVFQKTFPLTSQGLLEAKQAVIQARQLHFTHSEIDKGNTNA